uniref:Protein transport protein Sec31A n=1 Tax=Anthurium amnicola TaxID=1678845 RepID=A0A1D1Z3L1_9ARAE
MHSLVTESSLVSRSTEFEAVVQNGDKASLRALCEKKSMESESGDDKETWGFLKVMFEDDGTARTKLLAHLGFFVSSETGDVTDDLSKELTDHITLEQKTSEAASIGSGEIGAFGIDDGDDFFNNPVSSSDSFTVEASNAPLADQIQNESEEPVEGTDSSFDDGIRRALVVGDYKGAVSQCISANRMADALVIAHMGGVSLWESTRDQYLKKSNLSYLKVVSAMVKNDLMALVNTRPLDSWKETLALLCTFAQKDEWSMLCDILASRLIGVDNTLAATLCYICSGNINRTVEIWSHRLKPQHEGRSYVDLLQDLMEKTVVLTVATGQKQFSPSLSKLIENYAELLASQGLLSTAMEYLKLLGADRFSNELDILRDRIEGSAEEKTTNMVPTEDAVPQDQPVYSTDQSSFGLGNISQNYYQGDQPQQPQSISGAPYGQGYQQPFVPSYGGYQLTQPAQQPYQDFGNPSQIHGSPSPMFMPSQAQPVHQGTLMPATGASQPPVKFFVPTPTATLKNVEQYQQNTLASHLYTGSGDLTYQAGLPGHASLGAGLPQEGPLASHKFPQAAVPNPTPRSFTPVTSAGFIPRPSISPVQPTDLTPTALPQPAPAPAPPAPQPTVQTVDTSNVSAELRPVIATLTRLYNETSDALGGARANAAKKREIEDNSRKIGSLFAKLNSGDISPNAASKLVQLCQSLDSGDYPSALHIQVLLTTSDWDECNFWLAALKRMIKTRQTVR